VTALAKLLPILILLNSCASIGMSQSYDDCYRFEEGFGKDVVTGVAKAVSKKQHCVKGPVIQPSATTQLLDLPYPNQKTVVAVYQFGDYTGQRKGGDTVASFSTAVTQGSIHILTEALRDAGRGNWFVVVERHGLDALTKERQLVRSTFESYNKGKDAKTILKPLLYAGMIIEGGIVSYDTNIRTGGTGARYLGIGMKNQYREDIVTVTLRAVLVQTGEVLLNVTTTKTILSTGGGGDIFRFIELGTELVEMESGSTENEAVGHAVRAAIEAAVYGLVVQGLEKEVWDFPYHALKEEK
jgi:curli production assembly/transport component CsgG